MKHVTISGEHRTQAWFGPTRPVPFRYSVCSYDPKTADADELAWVERMKADALSIWDRDGIVVHGIDEFDDGVSRAAFERGEAEAARSEYLRTTPGVLS